MADQNELERLYREAQAALKAKEYDRAVGLLTQILVIDEDYKDVSRLLAQSVKLKRRRWYNDVRIWGAVFGAIVIGLLIWIVPKLSLRAMPAVEMVNPTGTAISTNAVISTITPSHMPTPIPLTWKRVNIGQEFERDKIIAFEIDPKDRDILYASMENAGFYQSIDGGISWRPIQIENVPADIATKLKANNDHSFDKGYQIEKIGPDGIKSIFAYTGDWSVSKDDGNHWSEFGKNGSPGITFDSTGSVYIYCDLHLCKYSPDGNQRVTLGKPDIGASTTISISPYDPNTIYVAGGGLAVSKDGGLTWTKLNNGLGSEILYLDTGSGDTPILYLQSGRCEGVLRIQRQKYYLGAFQDDAGQPLYISTNGGQTWELSLQNGCYLLKDSNDMILYRIGQDWIFTTNANHVLSWLWWSKDEGNTWQTEYIMDVYNPFTAAAHPIQSGVLYAYSSQTFRNPGYGGEKTFISKDYGNSWQTADSTGSDLKPCYGSTLQFIDNYRPMAIDPVDGDHVFVIDDGILLESHDSCGTTKTFTTAPNTSMNSIAFDPNNPDILYAGTDEGAYVSFDSGETWNQINDGLLGATVVYSIAVDKDSNVYAATPYGVFKLESK
jgi:photosystem II stability/assembly factor-like uncharacterized protein